MLGRASVAGIAAVATVVVIGAGTGTATAGTTYGGLDLVYTSTTSNFTQELPGRDDQNTYSPCAAPEQLVGVGAYLGESVLADPFVTEFKLGKAYNISFFPFDQFATPEPDSTRQIAEMRFKNDHDVVMGETTVCGESVPGLSYPRTKKDTPARSRTTASVDCGPGTQVVSGGVKAAGPYGSQYPVRSFPFDDGDADSAPNDGWRVSVDNKSNKDRKMKAYAVCTTSGGISYWFSDGTAMKRARAHDQTDCMAGQYVLGGGIDHDIDFGNARLVASRFPAMIGPDAWITEVDNLSNRNRDTLTYAICHA
jgi:hypothetical protein